MLQESAFRGASERYATLAETSTTLLAGKEAAAETAGKALDDLAAAKTAATAAHAEVLALKSKLLTARNQLEGARAAVPPCLQCAGIVRVASACPRAEMAMRGQAWSARAARCASVCAPLAWSCAHTTPSDAWAHPPRLTSQAARTAGYPQLRKAAARSAQSPCRASRSRLALDVRAATVPSACRSCAGVQETLRPLKHKEVTELRADVAREASQVALSYKEVSRLVSKLQANGA